MTHPYNEGQKVTYSNLSFKLCKERKSIFLVTKTVKDITNHLLKIAIVFTIANASIYTHFL